VRVIVQYVYLPLLKTHACRGAAMVAAATDFEAVGEDDEEDWVWHVVCVYVCVMCKMCVCESERERERVCVCVCVCV